MIRSLYVRVAVTFLLASSLSLIAPYLVGSRINMEDVMSRISDDMTTFAQSSIYVAAKLQPNDMDDVMEKMTTVKNFGVRLYGADGGERTYNDGGIKMTIDPATVQRVLNGASYDSWKAGQAETPGHLVVGLPLQVGEAHYAMFVFPHTFGAVRTAQRSLVKILLTMLLPGTLIILAASRYLIKPLRKLTEATGRIAEGDFDVRVDIRRKDELGLLAATFNRMAGKLKQMERMRQDFVANVSHEIQTPLTSIHGFAIELQQPGIPEEERLKYLRIMEKESARLSRLGHNLLKLASLEAEQHPFHPKEIELDEQLRRVVVACEPLWGAKGVNLQLELERVRIDADEDSLSQVWMNLLQNSIKFTPPGGDIRIEASCPQPGVAEVRIADSGIGIAAEDRERVFERFFKADRSRKSGGSIGGGGAVQASAGSTARVGGGSAGGLGAVVVGPGRTGNGVSDAAGMSSGSGLGLAIAKRIVELHHGRIRVESELGVGTSVTVTLPVRGGA